MKLLLWIRIELFNKSFPVKLKSKREVFACLRLPLRQRMFNHRNSSIACCLSFLKRLATNFLSSATAGTFFNQWSNKPQKCVPWTIWLKSKWKNFWDTGILCKICQCNTGNVLAYVQQVSNSYHHVICRSPTKYVIKVLKVRYWCTNLPDSIDELAF